MSLIEQEIKRRKSIKGRLSRSFESAKTMAKKEYSKAKDDFKEKQEFNKRLKGIEKKSYRSGLLQEAKRSGRRKAKTRYSKKRRSVIGSVISNTKTNPGFMDLPKRDKKGKDAFSW